MGRTDSLLVDAGLFLAAVVLMPFALVWLMRRAAGSGGGGLSIRNRDYWLRPEHRAELFGRFTVDMLALGVLVGALLVWADIAVVRANRLAEPQLGTGSWVALGLFLVAMLAWTVWLLTVRYQVPRRSGATGNPAPTRGPLRSDALRIAGSRSHTDRSCR